MFLGRAALAMQTSIGRQKVLPDRLGERRVREMPRVSVGLEKACREKAISSQGSPCPQSLFNINTSRFYPLPITCISHGGCWQKPQAEGRPQALSDGSSFLPVCFFLPLKHRKLFGLVSCYLSPLIQVQVLAVLQLDDSHGLPVLFPPIFSLTQ